MVIRLLVCAAMGAARLLELALSRRNIEASGPATEGNWSRSTYPLVVALHAVTIVGTLVFGGRARWPWLLVLLAVQPVRAWVLLTLRERWNTRAAVPDEMTIETRGPYQFVRHPNYGVVAVELWSLPMAFGLPWLGVASTVANAVLLGPRVLEEEAALAQHLAWQEAFAGKKRFIPGVF